MDKKELQTILDGHKIWLLGRGGKPADFRYADFRYADFRYAVLRYANLHGADLRYANLNGADLRYADLRVADLHGADLHGADLCCADLDGADLRYAVLRYANLHGADLRCADLRCADLCVKTPSINDHYFISEILLREATNTKERSWAGLVRINLNWCWEDFHRECSKSMINWAKKILCNKWPEFKEKF